MVKLFWVLVFTESHNYFGTIIIKVKQKIQLFRLVLFLVNVEKTVGIFATSVGNVQERFVKVSNSLNNYLRKLRLFKIY